MQLSFDHLVHFSPNPESAKTELLEKGMNVINGGHHEKWGTFNKLSYFGLSYIEWLGFHERAVAESVTDNDLIRQFVKEEHPYGHFGRFALRTENIEEVGKKLTEKGYDIEGPVAGSRRKEDGSTLEWRMLFVKNDEHELPLPFFIQWGEDDHTREQALAPLSQHPQGALKIENIYCAVHRVVETSEKWASVLELQLGEVYRDALLNATCRKLYLHGGNLILCESANGVVHETLQTVGERPFLVEIYNANEKAEFMVQNGRFRLKR
ncbi:VOC family protein [Bacillus sp. CGMCC 1.16541]|uniref:VOC family protein n=1 Tax=Bacillus sp. CGMCC 1.16541 TaxID=2185143 RepID=UPI000D72CC82|nr:VOC family protein [Bacillus sp. CGMCC 1.16541]